MAAAPAAQAAVEGDTGAAAPGTVEGPSTLMRCLAVRGPGPAMAQGTQVVDILGLIYPLANVHITMENPPTFNGKINYFDWAIFNSKLFVYQRVSSKIWRWEIDGRN